MSLLAQQQHFTQPAVKTLPGKQAESIDQLFQRVVGDDYTAFEIIFKDNYGTLCTYAMRFLKSRELAEETVDDVFCSIWTSRKKIQISSSFRSYLLTSVRNRSLDCLRKLKHEKNTLLENASSLPCKQSIAHETLAFEELSDQIDAAIAGLPKQCRLIFLMSRNEDLKYKEIAEILNISIKTVDTQMGRALKYLRKIIVPQQL